MRIAILNWRDSRHPEAGGAELYCHEVARELASDGHDVVLVASRPSGTAAQESVDGYRIARRGGRFTVYPAVLWWLLRHRTSIDGVFDSQNGIPFFSPLVLRRRTAIVLLMYHVHQEQFALYFPPVLAAVGRWLESSAARQVYGRRSIAAISPSTRAAVRTRLHLKGPIQLAPCGLSPVPAVERSRSFNPRIVTVGRLVPHKQVRLLVEAISAVRRTVPTIELHLIGDGSERPFLEAFAAASGLSGQVVFHGRVSDEVRDNLLASAWLTVNPTRGEGWGLSVLEANQHGVPAIAFRVDGMRDSVVDGVTGWLIDDPADLPASICSALAALSDPTQRHRMERSTLAWSAGFTWDRTARQLMVILNQESTRIRRVEERRMSTSDLATLVEIPSSAVPEHWSPVLRSGDLLHSRPGGYQLLLLGIDQDDVPKVLDRIGVARHGRGKEMIKVAVAGHQDALLLVAGVSSPPPGGYIDLAILVPTGDARPHLHAVPSDIIPSPGEKGPRKS
jgi:glycosyltransferase involved in cell wall biosynthesis